MTAGRLKLVGQVAAIGLVAGLLVLLIWKVAGGSESEVEGLRSGKTPPAPGFNLPRLTGDGKISLDSYRGKAVVVNFWASWCEPCKAEAPLLEQAWRRYRDRGLVVLGVNSQDLSSDARRFARQVGWTYPLVRDGAGDILGPYAVAAFPETFFVDRTGSSWLESTERCPRTSSHEYRAGTDVRRVAAVALVALVLPASASAACPELRSLEGELMCPTCGTTLELSNAPAANQIRRFVRERAAAGDSKGEIKDKLVTDFGPACSPRRRRRASTCSRGCCRCSRSVQARGAGRPDGPLEPRREPEARHRRAEPNGRAELDPALEKRLEEELARFE